MSPNDEFCRMVPGTLEHTLVVADGNIRLLEWIIPLREEKLEDLKKRPAPENYEQIIKLEVQLESLKEEFERQVKRLDVAKRSESRVAAL